jgi:pimeloyl-ACP methyl ester carboxylesterase
MPPWDGNVSEEDREEYERTSPDAPETMKEKIAKMFSIWKSEPEFRVADISKINCPVLVIVGDDDVIALAAIHGKQRRDICVDCLNPNHSFLCFCSTKFSRFCLVLAVFVDEEMKKKT